MKEQLKEIMSTVLEADINEESSKETVDNWDSLKHIELMLTIEEEFEKTISPDIIPTLTSFVAIYEAITEEK